MKPSGCDASPPTLRTTFRYKCTDCGAKNTTDNPPEDCMLHCSKCGHLTVQTCEAVKHSIARNK